MEKIKKEKVEAYTYLTKIKETQWASHAFNHLAKWSHGMVG